MCFQKFAAKNSSLNPYPLSAKVNAHPPPISFHVSLSLPCGQEHFHKNHWCERDPSQ